MFQLNRQYHLLTIIKVMLCSRFTSQFISLADVVDESGKQEKEVEEGSARPKSADEKEDVETSGEGEGLAVSKEQVTDIPGDYYTSYHCPLLSLLMGSSGEGNVNKFTLIYLTCSHMTKRGRKERASLPVSNCSDFLLIFHRSTSLWTTFPIRI